MKEIEKQQENIKHLIELVKENPQLEIVPMVDSDCVQGDDYSYYKAEWGKANVDECYSIDDRIYFKSEDYQELMEDYMNNLDFGIREEDEGIEEKAKNHVDNLAWEKIISVNINSL